MENFIFYDILKMQLGNKQKYINRINPPHMGFCAIIKNNKVTHTVNGSGWIEELRKNQYLGILFPINLIGLYLLS